MHAPASTPSSLANCVPIPTVHSWWLARVGAAAASMGRAVAVRALELRALDIMKFCRAASQNLCGDVIRLRATSGMLRKRLKDETWRAWLFLNTGPHRTGPHRTTERSDHRGLARASLPREIAGKTHDARRTQRPRERRSMDTDSRSMPPQEFCLRLRPVPEERVPPRRPRERFATATMAAKEPGDWTH